MATYQVQVGDTVNAIANRFGVPAQMVKGYRSNDPNVILPGETLDIGTLPAPVPTPGVSSPQALGTQPAPNATSVATGKPVYMPPTAPVAPPVAPTAPLAQTMPPTLASAPSAPQTAQPFTTTTPEQTAAHMKAQSLIPQQQPQDLNSLVQSLAQSNPELAQQLLGAMGGTDTSGDFLKQYDIDPEKVKKGFETSPTNMLPQLIRQVMEATGLHNVLSNINNISKEIEDLSNERDDKIQQINDNPFNSAGTKEKQAQILMDKYEQKISNRVNRLTLMQNSYSQARQEAQFAVSTAIGLYDKQRTFDYQMIQDSLDREEKAMEATRKLGEKDLQFVSGTANQPSGIFDRKTGTFIPAGGGKGGVGGGMAVGSSVGQLQLATAKANVDLIAGLTVDSYLSGAVGPNPLARLSPSSVFTGGKANFIAGVQQLSDQLKLDKLIQAKAQGATFGALSDNELRVIASAATKIGTWTIKDKDGNVVGYNANEATFKAELDKINNFAKLDYILKGGNPEDVEAKTMDDGTIWTVNSDGSYTQLQ